MNPPEIDRRALLKLGAAGAIWTVPIVTAIQPAAARDLGSRPPTTRPPASPPATVPQMGPPLPTGLPGTLPFTGNNEHDALVIGTAAAAAGASLLLLGETGRRALTDDD